MKFSVCRTPKKSQVFQLLEIDELSVDVHSWVCNFLTRVRQFCRVVYNACASLTRSALNRLGFVLLISVPIHLVHKELKAFIFQLEVLDHICVLFL